MYPKQKKLVTVRQNQPTKKIVEPILKPVAESVQTQDAIEQEPIIVSDETKTQLSIIELPTNFPELRAMEAYLEGIQQILALETDVEKSAQAIYDFFDKGAKQALEILNIVKQYKKDSKEAMDSAFALRNQYLLAERNAQNAGQLLLESKTAIAQFLAERSNPNQKN